MRHEVFAAVIGLVSAYAIASGARIAVEAFLSAAAQLTFMSALFFAEALPVSGCALAIAGLWCWSRVFDEINPMR